MYQGPIDVCDESLSEKRHDWKEFDKGANGHFASEHGHD
jgi:hypothetical protein